MRTLVIGDIHGAYRALKQILERISLQADDRLIFLGDYVDGWSESAEVIEYLMELEKQYSCIFIRGNHDTWCEDWLKNNLLYYKSWLTYGGRETVESYAKLEDKSSHMAFFERLRDFYIDDQNRLFIHAGYTDLEGPEYEKDKTNLQFDRSLWELAVKTAVNVEKDPRLQPKKLTIFKEIFIGHTPTLNYKSEVPMHCVNVWNVDTGAAFSGKLSALDVDTKQCWQSENAWELYPGERGRNKK